MNFSQIINHNDILYIVVRKISKDNLKSYDMKFIKGLQDYFMCDHTLQTNTHYMFCRTINDVEIIEE